MFAVDVSILAVDASFLADDASILLHACGLVPHKPGPPAAWHHAQKNKLPYDRVGEPHNEFVDRDHKALFRSRYSASCLTPAPIRKNGLRWIQDRKWKTQERRHCW